jgi:hypothetical protein
MAIFWAFPKNLDAPYYFFERTFEMEESIKIMAAMFGPIAAYVAAGFLQVKALSYITKKQG